MWYESNSMSNATNCPGAQICFEKKSKSVYILCYWFYFLLFSHWIFVQLPLTLDSDSACNMDFQHLSGSSTKQSTTSSLPRKSSKYMHEPVHCMSAIWGIFAKNILCHWDTYRHMIWLDGLQKVLVLLWLNTFNLCLSNAKFHSPSCFRKKYHCSV